MRTAKKVFAFFLAASLLLFSVAAFASGTGTLNEAETAGQELAAVLGKPMTVNVNSKESFDVMNARYVWIGNEALGCDLGLAIRISDEQMYFWNLELTPENLKQVILTLEESAPFCCLLYYENNEVKDSAYYLGPSSSVTSYGQFQSDVERITGSLSFGDTSPAPASDAADPILSCFPGLEWGMTRNEILDQVGKSKFSSLSSGSDASLIAMPVIYGETVTVVFVFGEDTKLSMFTAVISDEQNSRYLEIYTGLYGTPHVTTLAGAVLGTIGSIRDDPNGDCSVWKTDKTLIILNGGMVQYWPVR